MNIKQGSKMMIEEWRDVPGYEGLYQVSNMGRIKSLDRKVKYSDGRTFIHKGIILKPGQDHRGYLYVNLSKKGKIKPYRVHRCVAGSFLKRSPDKPEVNHIDENKENNKVSNLEWCNREYNNNYGTRIERIHSSDGIKNMVKERSIKVIQLENGVVKNVWDSLMDCERSGFHRKNIKKCCEGKQKTHKGFAWKFYEEEEGVTS